MSNQDYSAEGVCQRAVHRRSVLSAVLDGPGSTDWKLERVRLFIEESDALRSVTTALRSTRPMTTTAKTLRPA